MHGEDGIFTLGWVIVKRDSRSPRPTSSNKMPTANSFRPTRAFDFLMVVLCLHVGGLLPAEAQPTLDAIPISNNYVLRTWDTEDGLVANDTLDIAETPDGYLWIATWSGLSRFDGVHFTTFSRVGGLGMPADHVNSVSSAKDGTLWLGCEREGLVYFRGGRFYIAHTGGPDVWNGTSSVIDGAGGAIWAVFQPGPYAIRWKDGKVTRFSTAEGIGPGMDPWLCASVDGTVWFATNQACGFFDGSRFRQLSPADGGDVHIGAARSGGMWVSRGRQLYHYWKDGRREAVADLAWLGGGDAVRVLYEDREGNLWLGTRNAGLFLFCGGQFSRVPTSQSSITSVLEDRDGNIWVGTQGGGLDRLRPRCFFLRKAKTDSVIREDSTCSLGVDGEGRINASQGHTLVRATDPSNQTFAVPPGVVAGDVFTITPAQSGGFWLGGLAFQIRQWKDGKIVVGQFVPASISSLLEDREQNLWMSSTHGPLYCRRNGIISPIEQNGLVEPRALALDGQGHVWVGTEAGLVFCREGGRFQPVPLPDAKKGERIEFIVPGSGDSLWIGALKGGLYRWRSGRVDHLPMNTGLPVDNLKVLEIDARGDFWFGTGNGLFRVERNELDAVLDGRVSALRAMSYGRNDGLPPLDFNYGFLNSSARTPDGHVWFATTQGALEIDPARIRKVTSSRSSVLIEAVEANGISTPIDGQGPLILPPHPGAIRISYTLPQLSAPEQLRFRYRLLGLGNDTWYPAGEQREAVFTNLGAGDYTFEVSASEVAGSWLPQTAMVAFTIRAAWWETIWFRLACLVAGVAAFAVLATHLVKRRVEARIRQLEQAHALERERARIARDMHDELGASLTHIQLMTEFAASESSVTSSDLKKIAETARTVSSTLDQIVWMTNPRNDTLEHLVGYIAEFAQEYLHSCGMEFQLELPSDIPKRELSSDKRHQVLLAVKEALNNIIKHAEAHHVRIRLRIEQNVLNVLIHDDGKGFDAESISAFSNGLINMRQRMEAVGGTMEIESLRGQGTTIRLVVKV